MDAGQQAAVESWFIRRGVPHFIHQYRASADVFTRVAPLLTLVFLAEVALALNSDWRWWANVAAAVGGLAVLLGVWALTNRARGRRPLQRPDDVGVWELTAFVLGPALLPLLFGAQLAQVIGTIAGNLAGLGLIYLATSYGVVPMTRWAAGHLVRQLTHVWGLTVRALPMLLLFVTFLFINAEVWQLGADLTAVPFAAAVALFVVLGSAFVLSRLPSDLEVLAHFESRSDVERWAAATPAGSLAPLSVRTDVPLSGRERANLALVHLFVQALQVLAVVVAVFGFFVVFGAIAISENTVLSWTTLDGLEAIARLDLGGRQFVLSAELLRVSGFLASFSGLYFSVVAATDDASRRQFRAATDDELRVALAARALYLSAAEPR